MTTVKFRICRSKKTFLDEDSCKTFSEKMFKCHKLSLKPYVCDQCGMFHLTSGKGFHYDKGLLNAKANSRTTES